MYDVTSRSRRCEPMPIVCCSSHQFADSGCKELVARSLGWLGSSSKNLCYDPKNSLHKSGCNKGIAAEELQICRVLSVIYTRRSTRGTRMPAWPPPASSLPAAAAVSRGRKPIGGLSPLFDRVDMRPGHDVESAVGNHGGAVDGVAEVGFVDESFLATRLQYGEVTVLVSQHDLAVDHEG